jgi:hypothetical protein
VGRGSKERGGGTARAPAQHQAGPLNPLLCPHPVPCPPPPGPNRSQLPRPRAPRPRQVPFEELSEEWRDDDIWVFVVRRHGGR